MVGTCVDSALNELNQLQLTSSLAPAMKSQIQMLQLDLKFLKMIFWCCSNWDDDDDDSDMCQIQDTLRRAGRGLYASGSLAIREFQTHRWDLISSNLLAEIEQLKPRIGRICVDLLDRSLHCTYSTSQQILEFIDYILKNLKEFLKYKAQEIEVEMRIKGVEEILGFFRNFVDVTERGITAYENFQDFWNDVQTRANNAACVLFLYWIDDDDQNMEPKMIEKKIKPCALELTGLYLGVLKVSEPAMFDPVMTSEVVGGFVDFLLQYLPVSVKDYVPILGECLMFLVSFLVHPPSGTSKSGELFVEADAVSSLICSPFLHQTNEDDVGEEIHIPLLDFLVRVEIIKAEVKELYVETCDLSLFDFPKTNGLGFINFFVENVEEMLEIRKDILKPFQKEKIARIRKEILCLTCVLEDSVEVRNEEMEIKRMQILNVAYKSEHIIDSLMHSPIWYGIICLSDVMEEIKNIKIDVKRMEEDLKYNVGVLGAKMTTCLIGYPVKDSISTLSDKVDSVGFDDEARTIDSVGFDDEARTICDKLTGGSDVLEVVAIAGMPGIGKTTLANKVYNHYSINKLPFHKCAWCSVSRTYRSRELLLELLECIDKIDDRIRDMMKEDLSALLKKKLFGWRYLIVIDGIWKIAAWDELKDSFPNGDKRSRILLTSQMDNVASETQLPFYLHCLQPLSDPRSWELFQTKLSLSADYLPCLLEVGQQIVKNCKGLPLAIVTIAGLLSRTDKKLDFWKQIAQNTGSFVNKEKGYKKIVELSYNYLPDYLKPFFLYFGAFQEEKAISVRKLIQLWVAEGFVPRTKKANVDQAKKHLKDLTARNLVIVTNRGSSGEIKACRMHNLLHKLCLAKVKEESFFKLLYNSHVSTNYSRKHQQYRLCISPEWLPFVMSKPTGPHVRSLLFSPRDDYSEEYPCDSSFFMRFKLLRVLNLESIYLGGGSFPTDIILLIQLRYLALWGNISEVPSSIQKLWNLETFVMKGSKYKTHLPSTIWNMKLLKHVDVSNITLDEFEIPESAELALESFGTISVSYGEAAKELLRRLSKVRNLRCILYEPRNCPRTCNKITGLDFPTYLKSLNVLHIGTNLNLSAMKFPETLEKLTLSQCGIPWSQISIIRELPNLQILKLQSGAFVGETWDMDDDEEFPKLKYLKLFRLDIEILNASSYSFPILQHLVVERCSRLDEIPYVPSLEEIELRWCSKGAADSARNLQEEFEHLEVRISTQD